MDLNWTCPHCDRAQTVVDKRWHQIVVPIKVGSTAEGNIASCTIAIGCSNPDCNKTTVVFSIRPDKNRDYTSYDADWDNDKALYIRRARPESFAKPQPDYIPHAIVEDYTEACLISVDSPKAAATLARRCIQGMIRDFAKISKSRLIDEVNALRDAVNAGNSPPGVTIETVEAIDHLRSIGNIGAHMEKDIDLIVPVDAGEAQALIELIEMLFDEWYVARNRRQERLAEISRIGEDKRRIKAGEPASALEANDPSE